jgi:hypothetical protein
MMQSEGVAGGALLAIRSDDCDIAQPFRRLRQAVEAMSEDTVVIGAE